MILNILFLILIIRFLFVSPNCKKDEKYCIKCNPLTNLCAKCEFDNLFPDENGGCFGAKNVF